jgi:hypothetical protein
MLTEEQLITYSKWISHCDSVMDAHSLILDNLGRQLTEEELAQISAFRLNSADMTLNTPAVNEVVENPIVIDISDTTEEAPADNVTRMQQLATQIAETYRRKNADYGDSFGISVRKYGIIAALTRMSDKWNRLENLILNREKGNASYVADESVLDTLLDMATYCLMTVMEIEKGE